MGEAQPNCFIYALYSIRHWSRESLCVCIYYNFISAHDEEEAFKMYNTHSRGARLGKLTQNPPRPEHFFRSNSHYCCCCGARRAKSTESLRAHCFGSVRLNFSSPRSSRQLLLRVLVLSILSMAKWKIGLTNNSNRSGAPSDPIIGGL